MKNGQNATDVIHTVMVTATPETVYGILAGATRWPVYFHPTVHVEQLELHSTAERIQIWALAGDQVKTWTSRREFDPSRFRIDFRQEVSQAPIAEMSGTWRAEPMPGGWTEVVLEHSYRAIGDDPDALAWIAGVTDRNSVAELANVKALAESAAQRQDVELTFEDTVVVDGRAEDVYEFIWRADQWPARLPHVAHVGLHEDEAGVQTLEMDTVTVDGAVHTTKSIRVGFPGERIVYKQISTPALMTAHTGEWRVAPGPDGVTVTSQHTVAIQPDAVAAVLGKRATLADARDFVRTALSTNSRATLELAKEYAEGRKAGSEV